MSEKWKDVLCRFRVHLSSAHDFFLWSIETEVVLGGVISRRIDLRR